MSAVYNIACDENEGLTVTGYVTSDGSPRGSAVNIQGQTLLAVIHAVPGDGTPIKSYTTGAGIVISTTPVNKYVWTIPLADVVALGPAVWAYYVQETGAATSYTRGSFTINKV